MKTRRSLLMDESDYVTDSPNLASHTMLFLIWLLPKCSASVCLLSIVDISHSSHDRLLPCHSPS